MGQASVAPSALRADISRILKYAPAQLIGRDAELKLLNDAWTGNWLSATDSTANHPASGIGHRASGIGHLPSRPHVLTFVALGGEGKTALVAKWAAELAGRDWPGCDAAFAWSFYSQGTREQLAASSDLFLKEALAFFGDDADKAFAASSAGAFEKGQRLARRVGQRRSLLILDGLEPLQYAPTAPTPGELKDQGIAALLKGLAAASHGLCVVTTRYSLPDLKAFWQTTAPEVKLLRLSRDAGVHLLKTLGVRGTAQEFETLVEDVKGHALTLTLLGGFLQRAFHGDIRQRDRVKFEKADEKMDGGHAFRTMAAYEQWLLSGGDEGRREVAVLRLMGLFDRPADAGCLAALRREPIPGLTEPLAGLADEDWEFCLTGLETAKLLTVNRDASGALVSLDAHPLLREYFARQLRTQQPDAWRAAHRRLYEHLCTSTPDKPQPTLEDLQPLYQAVAHGCQAGLYQKVFDDVFYARIDRGKAFGWNVLGAVGATLGAVSSFFDKPWNRPAPALKRRSQAWLLNEAALALEQSGRLNEALEPMRVSGESDVKDENWKSAAISYGNLSELELTLGAVAGAVEDAEQSVTFTDRTGEPTERLLNLTAMAAALHQAGRRADALARFREAEALRAEQMPQYPLLFSFEGFRFCDLLLAAPERAAWQVCLGSARASRAVVGAPTDHTSGEPCALNSSTPSDQPAGARVGAREGACAPLIESCRAVSQRATKTLKWSEQEQYFSILAVPLDHLTLGRTALYRTILEKSEIRNPKSEIEEAVDGLRRSGRSDFLPLGLLTRAWLRFLTGARTGPESAQEDLEEAWEIAERGPMRLFMADIHLYRARLFGTRNAEFGARNEAAAYPWDRNPDGTPRGPKDDLAAAEKLINDCGYHRRDEELADAKRAILGS